jgi:hypothetical protein
MLAELRNYVNKQRQHEGCKEPPILLTEVAYLHG